MNTLNYYPARSPGRVLLRKFSAILLLFTFLATCFVFYLMKDNLTYSMQKRIPRPITKTEDFKHNIFSEIHMKPQKVIKIRRKKVDFWLLVGRVYGKRVVVISLRKCMSRSKSTFRGRLVDPTKSPLSTELLKEAGIPTKGTWVLMEGFYPERGVVYVFAAGAMVLLMMMGSIAYMVGKTRVR